AGWCGMRSSVTDGSGTSSVTANQRFFTALWSETTIVPPERFNTWSLLSALAQRATARLELGPGLRPRLPLDGTCFIDISRTALSALGRRGGLSVEGEITSLPFRSGSFDLVCAFDVIEHVADDRDIFRELRRVTRARATVVLSVPLDPRRWSPFDELVVRVRRDDPAGLLAVIREHDLVCERSATFGL